MGLLKFLEMLINPDSPPDPRCGQAWPGMPWDSRLMVETPRLHGETFEQHEYRMATERWRRGNLQARIAGCHCGLPATQVRYDHRNTGSTPVEFWTCDDHIPDLS
jgi:hypothetical protein